MAKTTIPSELIADNAVGITQLNVSDGSNGQFLKTDGSGTLSFGTVSTTTALDDIATGDAASTLATSSGNITIDSPADIILDADGADVIFKDGGSTKGSISMANSDITLTASDDDLILAAADNIHLICQGNESGIDITGNGAVTLYHDGSAKLVTSSTGVSITGNVNPSGTYGTSGTHLEMVYPAATNAELKIFRSNGNTAMRLTEQENLLLGFGTASQVSSETKLQVAANSASGGVVGFYDSDVSCSIGNIILRLAFTHDDDCTNSSFIHFADSGGTIGSVYAGNANSVVFSTVSDERLKENIVDASSQLNTVKNIKVREFDWKKDGTHQVGFIAQELNSIVPEAVSEGSDDVTEHPWGVDYGKLTPYLVKAIQEQQTTIEALTARIATLEG